MRTRRMLGALVVAPALVVLTGGQGHAATTGVVSFAGTLSVRPTATSVSQQVDFCFHGAALECANTATKPGVAYGADSEELAVDGARGTATYVEPCAAGTGLAPTGTASIAAQLHHAGTGAWTTDLTASWLRVGNVAVLSGELNGIALFIPLGVPTCGNPVDVLVVGAVDVAR